LLSFRDLLQVFAPELGLSDGVVGVGPTVVDPLLNLDLVLVDEHELPDEQRSRELLRLLGPNDSHMDFNIGCALWFGSRAEGRRVFSSAEVHSREQNGSTLSLAGFQQLAATAFVPEEKRPGDAEQRCVRESKGLAPRPPVRGQGLGQDGESAGVPMDNSDGAPTPMAGTREKKSMSSATAAGVHPIDTSLYSSCHAHRARGRVLLVGHGADELLAGYARHMSAFDKRGMDGPGGLKDELLKDLERLWQRNLGRDDRVLSDHGREVRHPFLDERFVEIVRSLEARADKATLREVAAELGLLTCCRLDKRAIQFGTRIAKRSNVAASGSNRAVKGGTRFTLGE